MDTVNGSSMSEPTPLASSLEIDSVLFALGRGVATLRSDVALRDRTVEAYSNELLARSRRGDENLNRLDQVTNDLAVFIQELKDRSGKTISSKVVAERLSRIYSGQRGGE